MNKKDQSKAAKEFAERWKDKGYEKGQSQQFWIDLLVNVYGVEDIAGFISFEDQVHLDHTSFIDGTISSTKVMIEQKSLDKDLRKGIRQSDGSLLNPFQQAKRYVTELPLSKHPRWIVTCNFGEFLVYDMEKPNGEPEQIFLKDLAKDFYRLQFLVDTGNENVRREMEISLKAGELVGKLYDAILKQYKNPDSPETLKSLNMLCVRLVFCLYAEDAGIFGTHEMFGQYLKKYPANEVRGKLIELFRVLNTKEEERDEYMDDALAAFPYVNGGLFADENIEIPRFTDEIVDLLINDASEGFDWSDISPTIFGAVFESTLNPETRRSGGMHYTSIENIHKVIDPLFLDELKMELEKILSIKVKKTKVEQLEEYRDKLAGLKFLDPACGSGNFLTQTYIELRRLENRALEAIYGTQVVMGIYSPIKVKINQLYGIEINDFAVSVAKTALWIAESQMMKETERIIGQNLHFLPLTSNASIVEGNALRIDWESVVPKSKISYIMGNPPFVGKKYQNVLQKADMKYVFGAKAKGIGSLDYVTAWYRKAIDYIQHTKIVTAFVSTNSIVQGEHIPLFWKTLYEQFYINILFAYQSFRWDSEAIDKAAVHCVIIGFSASKVVTHKLLFVSDAIVRVVSNIHPYLIEMPDVFIENRSKPLSDCKPLVYGSFALDDGNYTISENEYKELIAKEDNIKKYIKLFIGSEEFINGKKRYCIWLKNADLREVKNCQFLNERVKNVQEWRRQSKRKETIAAADTPMLFAEIRQPESDYMVIPITSSERRRYIPMGYMTKEVIASNHLLVLPNASLYDFGVLMSNVHMSWMRTVAGRLKSDYNYSSRIVYNNFPWCTPTDEQMMEIEKTAQGILDARTLYPNYNLAYLYDPIYMPPELRKAHQQNDKAVMKAYGFSVKMTESECVAELMKMYQKLTEK